MRDTSKRKPGPGEYEVDEPAIPDVSRGGNIFPSVSEFAGRLERMECLWALLVCFVQRGPGGLRYFASPKMADYMDEKVAELQEELGLEKLFRFDRKRGMISLLEEGEGGCKHPVWARRRDGRRCVDCGKVELG